MRTNYHTHTTRCLHATGSDEEFVLSAIKGGYQELGFSDHTPWKYHTDYVSDIRMTPEQLPGYVESLRWLQEKYKDQIIMEDSVRDTFVPALKRLGFSSNSTDKKELETALDQLIEQTTISIQMRSSLISDETPIR